MWIITKGVKKREAFLANTTNFLYLCIKSLTEETFSIIMSTSKRHLYFQWRIYKRFQIADTDI